MVITLFLSFCKSLRDQNVNKVIVALSSQSHRLRVEEDKLGVPGIDIQEMSGWNYRVDDCAAD